MSNKKKLIDWFFTLTIGGTIIVFLITSILYNLNNLKYQNIKITSIIMQKRLNKQTLVFNAVKFCKEQGYNITVKQAEKFLWSDNIYKCEVIDDE